MSTAVVIGALIESDADVEVVQTGEGRFVSVRALIADAASAREAAIDLMLLSKGLVEVAIEIADTARELYPDEAEEV